MTKQITVGYDGSGSSSDAVSWAATEAAARSAHLRIVSAYHMPLAADLAFGWTATEAYASIMDATNDGLSLIKGAVTRTHPDLEVTTEASSGSAGFVLVADAAPDDLIVVGASNHEGAAAFWLGSTPRHLVRHSPCPVVVVRGAATRGRPDRVVVGVDGSPGSDRALQWAGDEAARHQVDLLVVHCWMYPYDPVDTASSQAIDLTRVDAECVLDRAVESARERFGAGVTGALVENSPASGVLDIVRDGDLVVLGSRGRGALKAGLFGSTVNAVLDHGAVPVVVVPIALAAK